MYLCTTQRRNTDGSVVRYIQLAHNHRVEGVTRAEVLVNLGREDRLDREGLCRLVASINRYLGEVDDNDHGDVRVEVGDALTVVGSRPMGTAWLLDGLWSQLGVGAALAGVLGRPPRSVKAALHRARVLARDVLKKAGLTMEIMLNEL